MRVSGFGAGPGLALRPGNANGLENGFGSGCARGAGRFFGRCFGVFSGFSPPAGPGRGSARGSGSGVGSGFSSGRGRGAVSGRETGFGLVRGLSVPTASPGRVALPPVLPGSRLGRLGSLLHCSSRILRSNSPARWLSRTTRSMSADRTTAQGPATQAAKRPIPRAPVATSPLGRGVGMGLELLPPGLRRHVTFGPCLRAGRPRRGSKRGVIFGAASAITSGACGAGSP